MSYCTPIYYLRNMHIDIYIHKKLFCFVKLKSTGLIFDKILLLVKYFNDISLNGASNKRPNEFTKHFHTNSGG